MKNNYHSGKKLSRAFFTNMDVFNYPIWYNDTGVKNKTENFIRDIRKQKGWTQEELAERVNTTAATVQRHESGLRKLTQEWLYRYAAALECQPSALIDNTNVNAENPQEIAMLELMRMMLPEDQKRLLSMAELFTTPTKEKDIQ